MRDILSGFFLILEDQVRVGDVAAINGQGGLVEAINLRTIVLRDEQGTVHVFPSGEIKTLANLSKDFSYYVISVAIAFDADPDVAATAMQEAAASLRTSHSIEPAVIRMRPNPPTVTDAISRSTSAVAKRCSARLTRR